MDGRIWHHEHVAFDAVKVCDGPLEGVPHASEAVLNGGAPEAGQEAGMLDDAPVDHRLHVDQIVSM
jgi:hypothetical protein